MSPRTTWRRRYSTGLGGNCECVRLITDRRGWIVVTGVATLFAKSLCLLRFQLMGVRVWLAPMNAWISRAWISRGRDLTNPCHRLTIIP